jgi:hypothetical protein
MMAQLRDAVMITGFVATMMLLIEYFNVLTGGRWQKQIAQGGWRQYVLAAGLGGIPGCLGAFSVVAMYSHGIVSLGAVAAGMVAASGDEAFVMLALMPRQTLILIPMLVAIGIVTGAVVDLAAQGRFAQRSCEELSVHEEENLEFLPWSGIRAHWRECSAARGVLALSLALFGGGVMQGQIGPASWGWVRVSLLVVSLTALFIVVTVPEHFLEEHLWKHVVRKHAPGVFLWTFGALVAAGPLISWFRLDQPAQHSYWVLLAVACLAGLIPESGPHLVFVTLYVQGAIPFGVLLANSVVQDGHGMLPMLAHSRREFLKVKGINLGVGLLAGGVAGVL